MADELLSYYNRELSYLRKLGAEFADLHPKVAGRLRMTTDAVEDPHVLRLLEGVAFLNARIRHKLDDEFPELTEGLLGQLYPHYLAPVPSMAIVQVAAETDLVEAKRLARFSEFEADPVGGETCRFRTTQAVDLYPIEVEKAGLTGRPLIGPAPPSGAAAVIRLTLRCVQADMTFKQLKPNALRFFLRGSPAEVLPLHELIMNNVDQVVLADSASDPNPVRLGPAAILPVGFDDDQALLPYPARSAPGYRLLTEYFAFPEKFLFFDLADLQAKLAVSGGRKLDVFLYLNRSLPELERSVSASSFALNCTPAVNLFSQHAEPMPLTESTSRYQVIPDSRRGRALEVYNVERVRATSPKGELVDFAPIFGLRHAAEPGSNRYWHMERRPAGADESVREVFVSFVDLETNPATPGRWIASVETTCSNRDLPSKLPFGGGHPHLRFVRHSPGATGVTCLTAPTAPLRLPSQKESLWRLISHLTLNHLSLSDDETGAETLREILRLYDFRDAAETRAMIDSVVSITSRRSTARAPDHAMGALCRGLDVTMEFDEQRTSGGVYLLASVLEHFIGLQASINAFTRLTATVRGRSGVLRTWPPRAGDLTLL